MLFQFQSNTVCPRSLGPIYILGYYEIKSEIAIRNVSKVVEKLRFLEEKFYIYFLMDISIWQKTLAGYPTNQYPVNPYKNLINFNQTLLLPLSRQGETGRDR